MSENSPPPDPTRVTNQPSLTTSTGRTWLVVGGLFALIAIVMLFFLLNFDPPGLAAAALGAIVLLYAAMVITQLVARRGRPRLVILAALMIVMALVSLASVFVLAASQTRV